MSVTLLPPVFVMALPPSAAFGCSFILCYTRCERGAVSKIAAVSQLWTAVVVTHGLTTARRGSDPHRLLYLTHRDEFEREKKGVPPSLGSMLLTVSRLLIY